MSADDFGSIEFTPDEIEAILEPMFNSKEQVRVPLDIEELARSDVFLRSFDGKVADFGHGGYPHDKSISKKVHSPYQTGDILYVKEKWKIGAWNDIFFAIDHEFPPFDTSWHTPPSKTDHLSLVVDTVKELEELDYPVSPDGQYVWEKFASPLRWRNRGTMPLWAARIFIQIKSIRVEPLCDISEEDISCEGAVAVCNMDSDFWDTDPESSVVGEYYNQWFRREWDSKVEEKYRWDSCPWVFVYEFKRVFPDISKAEE